MLKKDVNYMFKVNTEDEVDRVFEIIEQFDLLGEQALRIWRGKGKYDAIAKYRTEDNYMFIEDGWLMHNPVEDPDTYPQVDLVTLAVTWPPLEVTDEYIAETVLAKASGESIEFRLKGCGNDAWKPSLDPAWNWAHFDYRVADEVEELESEHEAPEELWVNSYTDESMVVYLSLEDAVENYEADEAGLTTHYVKSI